MALPNSRQSFIEYCMRRLGWPVVEINVDPEQLEDRVDDALSFYRDYHYDATEDVFIPYQLTSQNISDRFIPLDSSIITVIRVLPWDLSSRSEGMFNLEYQMRLNSDLSYRGSLGSGSISGYHVLEQYLDLLNFEFNVDPNISFERHTGQLKMFIDWTEAQVGDFYIVEASKIIDETQWPLVWSDRFLLAYTTELFRRQWGENLIKYNGAILPGGDSINGEGIMRVALDNIQRLEEDAQEKYSLPINFLIG